MQFNEFNNPPLYILRDGPKKYGFFKFLVDCFMVVLTCGWWLIWIFVREMRKR